MKHSCRLHSETLRAVHKIDGFSNFYDECTLGSWNIDGSEWAVVLHPCNRHPNIRSDYVSLKLIFLSEARVNKLTANLRCRLVDQRGNPYPSEERVSMPAYFQRPSDSSGTFWLMSRDDINKSGFIIGGSLSIECAITVLKDPMAIPVPSSNLPQHLGELLENSAGADVTFDVSGGSFTAHKNVLAARSPVFKAEFFGEMLEKNSGSIDIKEMEPSAFGATLRFIYTDAVPELDKMEDTTILARHLLVAADRYGLDRLKVICGRRLAFAIDTSNVAATLTMAERHGCSQLKAKCVEFIAGGSRENLDAVMQTEGFKDLMLNSPVLLAELLVTVHGTKN
ncbi:unnamed protein product [Urochloa humidicola]